MPIVKKLSENDLFEIRDHRDNTSKDLVKLYSISQISLMDNIDTRTIRKSNRYLPVRVDSSRSMYRMRK